MSVSSVLHTDRLFLHVPSLRLYRMLGTVLVFSWGWYAVASFRTAQFGEDWHSLREYVICGLVWVFLPAVLVFLSQNFKKTIRRAGALTLVTLAAVFVWANVEEALTVRRVADVCGAQQPVTCAELTEAALVEQKWLVYQRVWPFQNHTITYDVKDGWHGGD